MKISLDDLIEHSFCISCNNADYANFAEDFKKKLGVDKAPRMFRGFVFNVGFYPALGIWSEDTQYRKDYSCSLTHAQIIRLAKILGWPYVCIFEDDARFVQGTREELISTLENLDDATDILRLIIGNCGKHVADWAICREVKKKATQVNGTRRFHDCSTRGNAAAYIVFKDGYDTSSTITSRYSFISDQDAFTGTPAAPYPGSILCTNRNLVNLSGRKTYVWQHTIPTGSAQAEHNLDPLIVSEEEAKDTLVFPAFPDKTTYYQKWELRTYASCLLVSFLALVKYAEAMGYSAVQYNTSRGTYFVEAKDYEAVQDLSNYELQGIEDLKGVKKIWIH